MAEAERSSDIRVLLRGTVAAELVVVIVPEAVLLSPLVIVGVQNSAVSLVVVGLGRDGVVRLAITTFVVLTEALLGPGVLGVVTVQSAVVVRSGKTVAIAVTVAGEAAMDGGAVVVRVGTPHVVIFVPGPGAPQVLVAVVPLVVGLGAVVLSSGVSEVNLLVQVLVAAPGVPGGVIHKRTIVPLRGGATVERRSDVAVHIAVVGVAVVAVIWVVRVVLAASSEAQFSSSAFAPVAVVLSPLIVLSRGFSVVELIVHVAG